MTHPSATLSKNKSSNLLEVARCKPAPTLSKTSHIAILMVKETRLDPKTPQNQQKVDAVCSHIFKRRPPKKTERETDLQNPDLNSNQRRNLFSQLKTNLGLFISTGELTLMFPRKHKHCVTPQSCHAALQN